MDSSTLTVGTYQDWGRDLKTYQRGLLREGLSKRRQGLQKPSGQERSARHHRDFLRAGNRGVGVKDAAGIDQEGFQARRRRLEESDRTTDFLFRDPIAAAGFSCAR